MPTKRTELEVDLPLSRAEFDGLRADFTPEEMEEKWMFFWNDPWLDVHRSWTGLHVYRIRFERRGDRWEAVEAWVNRDPEQYGSGDDAKDAQLVVWLVRRLRLGQRVPFPSEG